MKKLAILLKGTSQFAAAPRIGKFHRINGYKDPLYLGRTFTFEEFNEVAEQALDNQEHHNLSPSHYISVRVVEEANHDENDIILKGEDFLKDYDDIDKQELLNEIRETTYGGSAIGWNSMKDEHRLNYIQRALSRPAPGEEVKGTLEEPSNEPEEESDQLSEDEPQEATQEEDNTPYDYKHRGRGKYDVYNKDGDVVADNVTKDEAAELVPNKPEKN